MKNEILKLEKKLAEMRSEFACLRHGNYVKKYKNAASVRLAAQITDCEKMLIHARILVLQNDYSDHESKRKSVN